MGRKFLNLKSKTRVRRNSKKVVYFNRRDGARNSNRYPSLDFNEQLNTQWLPLI